MDAILSLAEAILTRHPAPALRLDELLDRMRRAGPDRRLSALRLRRILERHPARFRVLDVWRGPWHPVRDDPTMAALGPACWVAVRGEPRDPRDGGLGGRMRESVRWLARRLDARSRHDLLRWQRLALEEEAVRPALPGRTA